MMHWLMQSSRKNEVFAHGDASSIETTPPPSPPSSDEADIALIDEVSKMGSTNPNAEALLHGPDFNSRIPSHTPMICW